jgi:hypothetical protein
MKAQLDIEANAAGSEAKTRFLIRFLPWLLAVAAVAGFMSLVVVIHHNSPRTLISFHGYLHAAIAERFLAPGSPIPPENPFYAGRSLPYYWFFQFLAAGISRLTGWNVFFSLEAVVLAGAGLLGVASLWLGYRLFRSVATGLLMAYLVVAGTNPFGILIAGLKVLVQGAGRLKDDPNFLWNVVHPVYNLLRFNDIGALYGPLISFFLNMTSRPLALGSLMLSLLCLQWAMPAPRLFPLAALALTFALTTAASPIVGLAAGGVLGGLLLLFAVMPLRFRNRLTGATQSIRHSYLAAMGAIGAGLVVALPTYFHLLVGPSASQPSFYLFSMEGAKHLVTLALNVGVLLLLAGIGYIKSSEENRGFFRVLLAGSLVLLLGDATILLPSLNQSNLFHAAVVFLAVPATGSVVITSRRFLRERNLVNHRAMLAIVLLFLPTSTLLLTAYIARPAVPVDFDSVLPRRLPADSALAQFYGWAQKSTSLNTVFVLDPRDRVATNGNTLELPAMTNRSIFTEIPGHYVVPYPDAERRLKISIQLLAGEALSHADEEYVRQLGRPVFILVNEPTSQATLARLEQRHGFPVFRSGEIYVFRQQ